MHLAKLAVVYWSPDMSPEQTKWKYQSFFEDLHGCSEREIYSACTLYRRNPANKFFPSSAAPLRELILQERKDLRPFETRKSIPTDPRTSFWWLLPFWKPHWRESEVPDEWRASYEIHRARKGAPRIAA